MRVEALALTVIAACGGSEHGGNVAPVSSPTQTAAKPDFLVDPLGATRWDCEQGNGESCTWVGISYEEGDLYPGSGFVPQDYSKAFSFFSRACELSHMEGCRREGLLLQSGHGVTNDPAKAKQLFSIACDRGNDDACTEVRAPMAAPSYSSDEWRRQEAAASVAAQQAERQRWASIPSGSRWYCWAGTTPDERITNCYRTSEDCDRARQSWSTSEGHKKAHDTVGLCEPRLKAACYTFVWKLYQERAYRCSDDFDGCEKARFVAGESADIEDVTPCKAL